MILKAKLLNIQAGGKNIAILDDDVASLLGVHSSDRIKIAYGKRDLIAILNVASTLERDRIGVYAEIAHELGLKDNEKVDVRPAEAPESLHYIQSKIRNERLHREEIDLIVRDVVERHLSDIEIAAFVTSLYVNGLSIDEAEALSEAMVRTGSMLNLDEKTILDKHSIGGIPGDKTTILIVPIVAAAGLVIPKTSSRAVTSPAGTADRVESLCPVDLSISEIKEVVKKTKGCMVWGGALDLAPADDIFIQVEYPLGIDPMLLPSIMSKKKAIGATHIVVDIPTGRGAKAKTIGEADDLANDFIDLGKRLGIEVQCGITFGEQPLGYSIGPALEAREALSTIMGNGPSDLREKAISLGGILLEMVGLNNGKQIAERLLTSGKAEQKLRQIIDAQGGNSKVKPEDIAIGDKKAEITAQKDGQVFWINNEAISKVAREAGAPRDKRAGVLLKTKLGDHVAKGKVLYEIIAERSTKLQSALKLANKLSVVGLTRKPGDTMLIGRVPTKLVHKKVFTLER